MKIEESYWNEREFINDLIDQIPAAIFWKNTESVFLGCNKYFANLAALSSPKEIIGKTDYDLPWGKHQGDLYRRDDQEVMAKKMPKMSIEESQTLSNGKVITLLTNKMPLYSKQKVVVGVLAIFQDITSRKEMELSLEEAKNQAEAASIAKTDFIANMSHDIRTPLSGIVGMSGLLEKSVQQPEQKQQVRWINECGEQLLSLLNGILDVVSADHVNEFDLHEDTIDLHQCIHDIVRLEMPTIKMKGLDLYVDIPKSVSRYIVSDSTKLHRILLNLLGNAIKFTKSGHVAIEVKQLAKDDEQQRLRFQVIDTGIGVPFEIQHKVFERFFRVTPSYKGLYAGPGVGLHIAQSYAKLLGSEIKLTSQEGVGTTFYFDLSLKISNQNDELHAVSPLHRVDPLLLQTYGGYATSPTTKTLINTDNAPHLLLVEDNRIALEIVETHAVKAGCRFTSAVNGERALELAKSMDFDLIVTDVGLPGLSGNELTIQIREWEALHHKRPVPIIGLTAHILSSEKEACLRCGMNAVLSKPVNAMMLNAVVEEFVDPLKLDHTQSLGEVGREVQDSHGHLSTLPLLDTKGAIECMGSTALLKESFSLMVNQEIPKDLLAMQQAFLDKDWDKVEKLVFKLKGGAVYCGTKRLLQACQNFEYFRHKSSGELLENIYLQLFEVMLETKQCIEQWISVNEPNLTNVE